MIDGGQTKARPSTIIAFQYNAETRLNSRRLLKFAFSYEKYLQSVRVLKTGEAARVLFKLKRKPFHSQETFDKCFE